MCFQACVRRLGVGASCLMFCSWSATVGMPWLACVSGVLFPGSLLSGWRRHLSCHDAKSAVTRLGMRVIDHRPLLSAPTSQEGQPQQLRPAVMMGPTKSRESVDGSQCTQDIPAAENCFWPCIWFSSVVGSSLELIGPVEREMQLGSPFLCNLIALVTRQQYDVDGWGAGFRYSRGSSIC